MLKAEGAGVLLVTHDPEEALRMADRIALMRDGQASCRSAVPTISTTTRRISQAAAFFSDLNVIHGVVQSRQTDTPFGRFLTPGPG